MIGTFENTNSTRGTTPTLLGWIVCLSALPLLCGVTGCSKERSADDSYQKIDSDEQHASLVRPAGRIGPAGAQGVAGSTGAEGSTTAGVVGAVGDAGVAGPQGSVGATGTTGATQAGAVGAVGPLGEAGLQGLTGATGAEGPAGIVSRWTLYRDIQFAYNRSDLQPSEVKKVSEIVWYLQANPSLKVGLDGSLDPRGTDPRNQDLSNQRVNIIHDALVNAGVPDSRIEMGAFGDTNLTRDRRVAVLLKTAN